MVASDSFLFAAPYSATDNRLYASQRTAIYKINLQDGKALRLHTYPAFAVDPHLFLDEPFLFLELGHSHALAKVDLRSNEVKKLPGSEDIYYNYLGRDLFVRDRPITEPEAKTGGFYKWLEAVDPATEEVRWKTKLPIENISTAMGESLILSYWFKDEQGCPTSGDIVEEIDLKTGQTVWKYAFANRIFLFETEPGRLIQWLPQVAFVVTSQPGQNYIHVVSRKTGRALRSLAITDEEPLPSNPYLKATTCVLAAGDFLFVARASGRLIVYPVDLFSR
jgi:hypothetical protein